MKTLTLNQTKLKSLEVQYLEYKYGPIKLVMFKTNSIVVIF